jgi:hypothetical protein
VIDQQGAHQVGMGEQHRSGAAQPEMRDIALLPGQPKQEAGRVPVETDRVPDRMSRYGNLPRAIDRQSPPELNR